MSRLRHIQRVTPFLATVRIEVQVGCREAMLRQSAADILHHARPCRAYQSNQD